MNILVCMKQILDPEIPARDFRVDAQHKEAERGSANLVTNIFCENALETALVINEGDPHPDPLTVAQVLAAAAKRLGSFDLILVGRESGDWGAGQTGGLLAEELGWPCVSFVDTIESVGGKLRVKRQTESGFEIVEAQPPALLTITNDEHNVPRIPKVRDVMLAHRQPLTTFTPADLGVDVTSRYYEVAQLSIPQKESHCEFVPGDTLDQKVDALARRLLEVTASL